jgi:hypothetical protein
MTTPHQALNNAQTFSANNLEDALEAFVAAQQAAASAGAVLATKKTELDTAWVDFSQKNGAFSGAMLTPPAGYAPPTV